MSNPGIEKLVYKATNGDITISGEDIQADGQMEFQKIVSERADGSVMRQGNSMIDFEFVIYDDTNASDIAADESNGKQDLEIWHLGSGSADKTVSVQMIDLGDNVNFDPQAEDGGGNRIRIYGVYNT